MKIRIKFRKYGVMKFIGHLDIMRYFQKAMRRADIDICYSEGFSPHQIMSFAAPLGVGITSDGEYLDIEVHSTRSSEESIAALNSTMVEGLEVTGYVKLPDDAKTAMSIVTAAEYELSFKDGYDACADISEFQAGLLEFFTKPETIPLVKQTKKGERVIDLKQLVYHFEVIENAGKPAFLLTVSTGSIDNLKPELVLEALFGAMGFVYNADAIQIHRKDVFASAGDNGGFVPLGEMGADIV